MVDLATDEDRFARHTLGQVLGRSLSILRQDFLSFCSLAALLAVPAAWINVCTLRFLRDFESAMDEAGASDTNDYDPEKAQEIVDEFLAKSLEFVQHFFWAWILLTLLGAVVKAAIIRTTAQSFVQQSLTLGSNLKYGVGLLPTIILWSLLYVFGFIVYIVAVMIVMLLIVGLAALLFPQEAAAIIFVLSYVAVLATTYYIAMILVFCMPAITIERVSAVQSFARAWSMTRGQRCLIFCSLFILFIAAAGIGFLEAILVDTYSLSPTAQGLIDSVASFVFIPLGGIVITVLYIHVRVVNEGCTRDILVKDLRESAGSSGTDRSETPNTPLNAEDDSAGLEEALLPPESPEEPVVAGQEEMA